MSAFTTQASSQAAHDVRPLPTTLAGRSLLASAGLCSFIASASLARRCFIATCAPLVAAPSRLGCWSTAAALADREPRRRPPSCDCPTGSGRRPTRHRRWPRHRRRSRALQRTLNSDLNRQGGANSALVIDETTDRTLWAYNDTAAAAAGVGREAVDDDDRAARARPQRDLPDQGLRRRQARGRTARSPERSTCVAAATRRSARRRSTTSCTAPARPCRSWPPDLRRPASGAIAGRIVGDESYFDSLRGGPDSGYQPSLETEGSLSALSFDAGFTDLHEDQLDANPPLVATQAFASALRAAGVERLCDHTDRDRSHAARRPRSWRARTRRLSRS